MSAMSRDAVRRRSVQQGLGGRRGFTLTELLVVIGLIAVLISLLLPVVGRVRAAANSAACLANLRQMNTAWTVYLTESRGRLPDYVWQTPMQPDVAWNGYWLGILARYRVQDGSLLCPVAREPIPYSQPGSNKGAGNVHYAWNGQMMASSSVVRLNPKTFRVGSYGYNRRLTTDGKYGGDDVRPTTRINQVKVLTEVPVFFDSANVDAKPINGSEAFPAEPPEDLSGENATSGNDHWRFLIARHGRGINVGLADGSARWVPLEETYRLRWAGTWEKYTLKLPLF